MPLSGDFKPDTSKGTDDFSIQSDTAVTLDDTFAADQLFTADETACLKKRQFWKCTFGKDYAKIRAVSIRAPEGKYIILKHPFEVGFFAKNT